jgi:hypothetical protein
MKIWFHSVSEFILILHLSFIKSLSVLKSFHIHSAIVVLAMNFISVVKLLNLWYQKFKILNIDVHYWKPSNEVRTIYKFQKLFSMSEIQGITFWPCSMHKNTICICKCRSLDTLSSRYSPLYFGNRWINLFTGKCLLTNCWPQLYILLFWQQISHHLCSRHINLII